MIDHTMFETAYKAHARWVRGWACKLYKIDPDRLVSDTWSRVWIAREHLDRIDPGLLKVIMLGLSHHYFRDKQRELKHLEKRSRSPHYEWEDCELPEIDPSTLPPCDRSLYLRLREYAESNLRLKDTGIPRTTLKGFRVRMRKRFQKGQKG